MENLDWKDARGNEKEERGISKVDSVVHDDYFISHCIMLYSFDGRN